MAHIQVQATPGNAAEFRVCVSEGNSETVHLVTVDPAHEARLTQGKVETAELVRRSFEFLLRNEAKESILRRFNLRVISEYFPNYEETMQRKLQG